MLKTFANQSKLPKLPVPALPDTVARYLKSVRPLLLTSEAIKSTEAACHDFLRPGGIGQVLHSRLLEYTKTQDNWLDKWWLKYAYHSWRSPSMVNSNWLNISCTTSYANLIIYLGISR